MRAIYKYPLKPFSNTTIKLPLDAQILSVQLQREVPTVWALVNPNTATESRIFLTMMTGENFDEAIFNEEAWTFLGTLQHSNGLVSHIWVDKK